MERFERKTESEQRRLERSLMEEKKKKLEKKLKEKKEKKKVPSRLHARGKSNCIQILSSRLL